jgi:hypothetical protein
MRFKLFDHCWFDFRQSSSGEEIRQQRTYADIIIVTTFVYLGPR